MEELKKKIESIANSVNGLKAQEKNKQKKSKKKNKNKKNNSNTNEANLSGGVGTIRLKRKEMLTEVKGDSAGGFVVLKPSANNMTFLHNLANCFTEIKYHSMSIHYVSSVGTTVSGLMTCGFKAGSIVTAAETSVTKVAALSPSLSLPVWNKGSMNIPKDRLMTRRTYVIADTTIDSTPGSLLWLCSAAKDTTVGALWVTYDVTLLGPKA